MLFDKEKRKKKNLNLIKQINEQGEDSVFSLCANMFVLWLWSMYNTKICKVYSSIYLRIYWQ